MSASSDYMAEPPAGELRHTTDPTTLHRELAAVAVSTSTVALVAVVLRLFTRARVTGMGVHLNDYMVVCAMMCSLALLGCNFPHMRSGLGYHMWEVKTESYMFSFQVWTLVGTILYATSLAFSKLSILLFYIRLSPQIWFRICIWLLVASVIIYATVYNLVSIFGCTPIAATWDLSLMPGASCMDQLTKYMALSILNIIIDVFTLVLPIPIIAGLQMPKRQKISVCGIFATGGFVCAVAVRRTTLLQPLMVSPDYTWHAVEQFQWCFAEVNASIVCACAPALKPFFVRYLPGLLTSHFRSSNREEEIPKNTERAFRVSHSRFGGQPKSDTFELRLRDDVSEETAMSKQSAVDDEAQLWEDTETRETGKTRFADRYIGHAS